MLKQIQIKLNQNLINRSRNIKLKSKNIIIPSQVFKAKTHSTVMASVKVLDDDTALLSIKEGGRQKIKKIWSDFKDFIVEPHDWELQ